MAQRLISHAARTATRPAPSSRMFGQLSICVVSRTYVARPQIPYGVRDPGSPLPRPKLTGCACW